MTETPRRFLILVAALLLCLAMIGVTCVPLSGHLLWAELLASLQPMHALAVTLATALSLLLRHKILSLVSGTVALAMAVQLAAVQSRTAPASREAQEQGMTLLAFNVRLDAPAQDAYRVASADAPDIAIFFEANTVWKTEFDKLATQWPFLIEAIRDDYHGVSVRGRLPLKLLEMYEYGTSRVPVPIVEVEAANGPFILFAVHALAPLSKQAMSGRNDMLMELAQKAKKYAQSHPVILAGDLNITPYSATFARISEASGLKPVAHPWANLLGTWPTWLPFMTIPIDHTLISNRVKLLKAWRGETAQSDHYPLLLRFLLTP